jgi:RNA polymerase sigma factor (TIGR02999 family)
MAGEDEDDISDWLRRWREGDGEAEEKLFRVVGPDLHKLAHYFLGLEKQGHPLSSSDLVNEMYFKLVAAKDRDWQNRRHFFAIAAKAMRRYLIDYARKREKRQFVPLADIEEALQAGGESKMHLAFKIDKLLDELERQEPEFCSVVELKFFLGLKDEEAADALGLSLRSFQRRWQDARKCLFEKLDGEV